MTDLTAKLGPVGWKGLKQELMGLPKETLAEMVNLWLKTYWSNQNLGPPAGMPIRIRPGKMSCASGNLFCNGNQHCDIKGETNNE